MIAQTKKTKTTSKTTQPAKTKNAKKASPNAKPTHALVHVQRLEHADGLPLPAYQTEGAAGLDLIAALDVQHPLVLAPGARALVPTGLVMELPQGYEAQVRPRSGLALKHGITVLNSPGTIDSDYRGEVQVILVNLGQAPFEVRRGERIAQLVISPVTHAQFAAVNNVSATARGKGGFGSTGKAVTNKNAATREQAKKKKSIPKPRAAAKKARSAPPHGRNR